MFTIQYVKDLKWCDQEHTLLECVVKYAEFDEEHPAGVKANDGYSHIQELWQRAVAGEFGAIAEYVAPPVVEPGPPRPPVIPTSVTMRQARLALFDAGLLSQVDAAISQNPRAQIEWEYATTVERNSELTQSLASGLGLTEQQLDDLFTTAAAL